MLTSEFDYELPKNLIAQAPLPRREESRMMVLDRKKGEIIHSRFKEFPNYLRQGDVLVLNIAKVIPARIWGNNKDREIEFLFLKEREKGVWEVLCRPASKVRMNDTISFLPGFEARVKGIELEGKRVIQFSSTNVLSWLKKVGYAPLPPYIKRSKKNIELKAQDLERYQTVFAQKEGSIAAPTAGLHFTPQILERIKARGVRIVEILLDVGQATFQPVRVKRIDNHHMLEETYFISPKAAREIYDSKKESRPVVAVGTTSVRALENAARGARIQAGCGSTNLFISPGYEFKVADRLLTNFHLPQSTLLMLVAAFAGLDFIKKAYQEAVKQKYRFYSYGDCMLIF
jgi:S-adenosylmethionine:tRNA ribosyltransferase-isomerase